MKETLRSKTILIVDDEPLFCEVLSNFLEKFGYHPVMATNGREAFEKVRDQKFDLVLSDIRMPGGDGLEFLEKAREWDFTLPIIVFVSDCSELTPEKALSKGAVGYFAKPFDMKELIESISRILS